jgi:hypothetical protein
MAADFGTTSPSVGTHWYVAGTQVTIEAFATNSSGERFLWNGWTGSGLGHYTGMDNPATLAVTMNGPITETASWIHEYELTMAADFGTTSPSVGTHWYVAGTQVTIEAFATNSSGERFLWNGWTGSGLGHYTGMDNPATLAVTMNGPITETASWIHEYELTMAADFGTTSPSVGTHWYVAGTQVTIEAFATNSSGERFLWNGWTGSGSSGNTTMFNPAEVTMNSAVTETASWIHQYQVTFAQSGLDPADAQGTVVTVFGSDAKTVSQLPNATWVDDGSSVAFSYSAIVDSSVTGKQYVLTGVSGNTTAATVTVNSAKTVTGTYITTELSYTGTTSGQYSDPVTVSATLTSGGTGVSGVTITFTIGTDTATATTGASGSASTTITLTQASGDYTVTASCAGAGGTTLSDSDDFIIDKEDVTIGYFGDTDAMTNPGATSALIQLQAHLDQTDVNPGDLELAKVEFELVPQPSGSSIIVHDIPVSSDGDAITTTNIPIGTYLIKVRVETNNEYWTGMIVDGFLNVLQGTGSKMVTGGGWIPDSRSTNGKGNFGFTVNYQKSGAPKGHFVYLWKESEYIYLIKSNSWSGGGLTFKDAKHAYFIGRCTIVKIERATGIETTIGNYRFRVDIFDYDAGTSQNARLDTFALQVWNPSTSAIYRQIGTSTLGVVLGGGNIVIHSK